MKSLSLPSLPFTRLSAREKGTNTRWVSFKTSNLSPKTPTLSRVLCLRAKSYGGVGDGDAVIIVDHGSRRKESNLLLNEFVEMFKHKTGYEIVEPAHMDIPSLSSEAAKEHPGVSYIVTAPLGLHELLVDVMNDRIKHCLKHISGDADECSVCAGTGKCRLYNS
ncbi:sirohydrochlorin ferrochelatase, chloroplastic isoform X3 [Arachis stenosperma]|uniref:sirohydrochlorin ferrochelatase, chloroplastic isoform X3 n=1 Tax=Arachis stenosperma TaxID=217475 RepID=UPI0025ACA576|nr:sirohydrochlorin ferrochelatase, chloroplastic isoform X3 [Arachis stenosperma]